MVSTASYLSVDGSDDGGPEPHPGNEGVLEVLVQDDGLQDGAAEHEKGQGEAPP